MDNKKINFEYITACEMCGLRSEGHKIMGQRLDQSQGMNPKKKMGISVSVFKCINCNLVYSNPLPTPNDIQDHYGIPPEDYWVPEYFNFDPEYFSEQIGVLNSIFPTLNGLNALDVGSGIGKCLVSLEKEGMNAYGIESSLAFYEKAISEMNIKKERLTLSMIEDVKFENNKFDFITFGAVFEHLYHPSQILKKSLQWLKPNGVIHIEVPSSNYFLAKLVNLYYRLRGTNYVTNLSPMHSPFHLYEFDIKSFEALAKKLKFEVVNYEHYVGPIYFVPKLFHRALRWYMHKTKTGMQFTIYIRKIKNVK